MTDYRDGINKLALNPLVVDMKYKYRNSVELSGWIIAKPRFYKHDKLGVQSASLVLCQMTNANSEIKVERFSCMVYVKDLVEQLKKQENVFFVVAVGKLRYSPKIRNDYTQVVEMKTLMELDMPLAD